MGRPRSRKPMEAKYGAGCTSLGPPGPRMQATAHARARHPQAQCSGFAIAASCGGRHVFQSPAKEPWASSSVALPTEGVCGGSSASHERSRSASIWSGAEGRFDCGDFLSNRLTACGTIGLNSGDHLHHESGNGCRKLRQSFGERLRVSLRDRGKH